MENYWDFIFRVNYSNCLYACAREEDKVVKCFVGFGNNAALIKGILRRRFWLMTTDKVEEAQFVWTQLKVASIFKGQKKSGSKIHFKKVRK
jgi:hypothetical protein